MFEYLKSLFEPKSKRPGKFSHPALGVITFESGIWCGETLRDGRRLRFYVGGSVTAPDSGLLDCVERLFERFPEVERTAIEFIRAAEDETRLSKFTFDSLNFLWEDKSQFYALEFTLSGDDFGIWRVEFEGDQPKSVGRDD